MVYIYHSRLRDYSEKYLKKLMRNRDIKDSLERLDKLTQEEARMASAEQLKMTHSVDAKVVGVQGQVQDVCGDVQGVRDDVHDVRGDVHGVRAGVQDVRDDVQGVRSDVQDVGNNVQDVKDKVQGIDSNVRGVDDKVDQANRSLSLKH